MKLYAISDLHLDYAINRAALQALPPHPEDWLILGGDLGHTTDDLQFALQVLSQRFQRLFWVPGNHDLWTLPKDRSGLRGEAKYQCLVALCRDYGVSTPEDPYVRWSGTGEACLICPLFLLYDYSFRPAHVPQEQAVEWAAESGVLCMDELLLHPAPYASKADWCSSRYAYTERRLLEVATQGPLVLINHFPLREDMARLRRIPRFTIWCGTRRTTDWHVRFPVTVAVSGHLHIRSTTYRDGVRFEEVSLGYPRDWQQEQGMAPYLREILPGPRQPLAAEEPWGTVNKGYRVE
jgi:3',5'-cyclic AMP phosphodiesterase CpdA